MKESKKTPNLILPDEIFAKSGIESENKKPEKEKPDNNKNISSKETEPAEDKEEKEKKPEKKFFHRKSKKEEPAEPSEKENGLNLSSLFRKDKEEEKDPGDELDEEIELEENRKKSAGKFSFLKKKKGREPDSSEKEENKSGLENQFEGLLASEDDSKKSKKKKEKAPRKKADWSNLPHWILSVALYSIPLVNIVYLIITVAMDDNRKNWAIASLIIIAVRIVLVIAVIAFILSRSEAQLYNFFYSLAGN